MAGVGSKQQISAEEVKARWAKAAQDAQVRQSFKMPQAMATPVWVRRLDAELAVAPRQQQQVTVAGSSSAGHKAEGQFPWMKYVATENPNPAEHADWVRLMRNPPPVEPCPAQASPVL
jgi:hypothetical protein